MSAIAGPASSTASQLYKVASASVSGTSAGRPKAWCLSFLCLAPLVAVRWSPHGAPSCPSSSQTKRHAPVNDC